MASYKITLSGGVCGKLWMPAMTGGMDINVNLSREIDRFTDKPTLRELLLHVLMEHGGDFQSASFTVNTDIVVSREVVTSDRRRMVSRTWSIGAFKSVTDLVDPDAYSSDFYPNDDEDC